MSAERCWRRLWRKRRSATTSTARALSAWNRIYSDSGPKLNKVQPEHRIGTRKPWNSGACCGCRRRATWLGAAVLDAGCGVGSLQPFPWPSCGAADRRKRPLEAMVNEGAAGPQRLISAQKRIQFQRLRSRKPQRPLTTTGDLPGCGSSTTPRSPRSRSACAHLASYGRAPENEQQCSRLITTLLFRRA